MMGHNICIETTNYYEHIATPYLHRENVKWSRVSSDGVNVAMLAFHKQVQLIVFPRRSRRGYMRSSMSTREENRTIMKRYKKLIQRGVLRFIWVKLRFIHQVQGKREVKISTISGYCAKGCY